MKRNHPLENLSPLDTQEEERLKMLESEPDVFERLSRALGAHVESEFRPSSKFFLRYGGQLSKQLHADIEFGKRKRNCERYLEFLRAEILEGYINGLRELAFIAHSATTLLNSIASKEPAFASAVAPGYPTWPIIVSEGSARDKAVKEFLRAIGLDLDRKEVVSGQKAFKRIDPGPKWALILIQNIDYFRRLFRENRIKPSIGIWMIHHHDFDLPSPMLHIGEVSEEFRTRCQALAPFSKAVFESWSKLANELFLLMAEKTGKKAWDKPEFKGYIAQVEKGELKSKKLDGKKFGVVWKAINQAMRGLCP